MINKKELQEIIDDLIIVCKGSTISDEVIFQESCSYHRGMLANESRKKSNEEPPTEKQIQVLKKYKKQIPKTKNEAKEIISELFKW